MDSALDLPDGIKRQSWDAAQQWEVIPKNKMNKRTLQNHKMNKIFILDILDIVSALSGRH